MKVLRSCLAASFLSLALPAGLAAAQTNVSATDKYSWSENCGWMNWADAGDPVGAQGARFGGTFASGLVWMENAGWLNLGSGSPADGVAYGNITGDDAGVNIAADGSLSGMAWGANIGWVNFTLPSLPASQQPRLDVAAGRLYGYAWGENIGWISLNGDEHFVGVEPLPCTGCAADYNADGGVDGSDVGAFFSDWEAASGCSDVNQDGGVDGEDVGAFFLRWEQGGC